MKNKLWCECSRKEQREFAELRRTYDKLNYAYAEGLISTIAYEDGIEKIKKELDKLEAKWNEKKER